MNFGDERWPAHSALAWVLTRDRFYTEQARPDVFDPDRATKPDDGIERTRCALLEKVTSGAIPTFGVPFATPASRARPKTAASTRIAVSRLTGLRWMLHNNQICLASSNWSPANARKGRGFFEAYLSSAGVLDWFSSAAEPFSFTTAHIGPPESPERPGYMTLSDAAYWIATKGGTVSFRARDHKYWQNAFNKLLPRICSEEVQIIGRRNGKGVPVAISGVNFSGIEIDYPYQDAEIDHLTPHLRCYGPAIPSKYWQDRYNDELCGTGRQAPDYTHLQVRRGDILHFWQFGRAELTASAPAAVARRSSTGQIRRFASNYIAGEQNAKRTPSMADFEKKAKDMGSRYLLRECYREEYRKRGLTIKRGPQPRRQPPG
jgi:hypothetical protein